MRIAVDARPAVFPHKTGVGYYTWNLLRFLPRVAPDDTFVAWYLNARAMVGGPRAFLTDIASPNLRERWTPLPATWFERASERLDAPRLEWLARFDVLFAPNFVPPPTGTSRLVVTIHDLAFRRFPHTAPQGTRRWLRRLDRAIDGAARLIVPSEATRDDVVELYGVAAEKVAVIPHGVDHEVFRPAPAAEIGRVRRRFGLEGPYLLSLSGIEPRKNLPSLLSAFGRVEGRSGLRLVVAGGGVEWNPEGRHDLVDALADLPADVRGRVVMAGYVTEGDKVALLSGTRSLVYPSLYEGFGMPVLEAMACGAPVITSDVSALPEIAGDAALLIDPRDPERLAAAMSRVVEDDQVVDRMRSDGLARAAGFTWEESARRTAGVLRSV